jgi:lipopolysaccharide/colanic/teichoic acid biosynthesis glycosyltransferase
MTALSQTNGGDVTERVDASALGFALVPHVLAHRERSAAAPEAASAPVLPLRPHTPGSYERYAKRSVDLVIALAALVVLAPLIGLVAVAVLLRLGRPVLFRQQRVGLGGRPFSVYKFRTMGQDRRGREGERHWHGPDRRQTHKSDADPRHTELGRLLRRTSLDELPQLWNVLRGDMSIVGPRPELVEVVARYSPWQHHRHVVRPGLTGLWQVSARGGQVMHEVTHIDLEYVEKLSLRTDLRILLQTPMALLKRSGA